MRLDTIRNSNEVARSGNEVSTKSRQKMGSFFSKEQKDNCAIAVDYAEKEVKQIIIDQKIYDYVMDHGILVGLFERRYPCSNGHSISFNENFSWVAYDSEKKILIIPPGKYHYLEFNRLKITRQELYRDRKEILECFKEIYEDMETGRGIGENPEVEPFGAFQWEYARGDSD